MFTKKDESAQEVNKKKEVEESNTALPQSGSLFGGKPASQPMSLFGNPAKNIPAGSLFTKKEDKGTGEPSPKANPSELFK